MFSPSANTSVNLFICSFIAPFICPPSTSSYTEIHQTGPQPRSQLIPTLKAPQKERGIASPSFCFGSLGRVHDKTYSKTWSIGEGKGCFRFPRYVPLKALLGQTSKAPFSGGDLALSVGGGLGHSGTKQMGWIFISDCLPPNPSPNAPLNRLKRRKN